VACLLRHPYCRQVCCTTGQVHASRAHFKKDDIDGPEPCRFRGEEITRQELLVVMPQASAPSGTALRPLWCRRNPSSPGFRQISFAVTVFFAISGILDCFVSIFTSMGYLGEPNDLPALHVHDHDRTDQANAAGLPLYWLLVSSGFVSWLDNARSQYRDAVESMQG
jgi:hypothetical protein